MTMMLNQAQAEVVHSAMTILNAGHLRACRLEFGKAILDLDRNGTIRIIGTAVVDDERYVDHDAFAEAYGLKN